MNVDIKELTHGYQNCHTIQMLIYDKYAKERKSLYTWGIIRVNAILNHIHTRMIMLMYEGPFMVYKHECYQKRKTAKYPYPIGIKKGEIFIRET